MRICIIAEGCYPFVPGGVSSWLHELILGMPEHEFIIWAIGATENARGKLAYELPANVIELKDVYLDTAVHAELDKPSRKYRPNAEQWAQIRELLRCGDPDWGVVFDYFTSIKERNGRANIAQFLLDHTFLDIIKEICEHDYPYIPFSDMFWNVRSMFLPLLYLLGEDMPQADIYHSVSAGYAGVLGAMAGRRYNKPFALTEHGIYTREREEEILRSDWVPAHFKDMWISMFYMFTHCAYRYADKVTCLFGRASEIQREIGCVPEKNMVIQNGVHVERFATVPDKPYNGIVDIGAIVRVVPIKDIKTMLYAFSLVCEELDNVRLHIMGNTQEDEEYYEECVALKESLHLDNAIFTGRVNVKEYLARIDFTLLTSISEGQPLAVLEGMAAGRPAVTTDVGCCRELLSGAGDEFGEAGICVPAMHQSAMAEAIIRLARDHELCRRLGEHGRARVNKYYSHSRMMELYRLMYEQLLAKRR